MNTSKAQRQSIVCRRLVNGLLMVSFTMLFIFLAHRSTLQTVQADEGGHSHFRFGHITWEQVGSSFTARITFTAGLQRAERASRRWRRGLRVDWWDFDQ